MSNKLQLLAPLVLSLTLHACDSGSDEGLVTPPPSTPVVSVKSDQTISGFPHTIDYYIPSNAENVIIILHGGGGKKEGIAFDLGIKNDETLSNHDPSAEGRDWLIAEKTMAVFPQGQTIAGTSFAWTWNNYVMDSGQDDLAFLQALVASIKADPAYSAIKKFYLAGHSNGGMMANRMWCESPDTFDAFAALAGPPSMYLAPAGTYPCNPSTVKPYLGIIGDTDTVLATSGNMSALTWQCGLYNPASLAWVNGTLINDRLYHADRASKKCAATSIADPIVSGQLTTYSDCSGSLKFIVVSQSTVDGNASGGDHCLLRLNGPCITTLAGSSGLDYKGEILQFLKKF